jgi:hypothetical protein
MSDVEALLRGRPTSLSLLQKARLLNLADSCSLHPEPATFDIRVGRSSADLATALQVAVPAPGFGTHHLSPGAPR